MSTKDSGTRKTGPGRGKPRDAGGKGTTAGKNDGRSGKGGTDRKDKDAPSAETDSVIVRPPGVVY